VTSIGVQERPSVTTGNPKSLLFKTSLNPSSSFESIRNTPSFGGDNLLAIKLILALYVRKGELLGARWEEIDLAGDIKSGPVWHLPAARTKIDQGADIPLVPQVVEWLEAIRVLAGYSEFVFPKRRRDRRHLVAHMGNDTLNVALQRVSHGLPHFTLHDLRRTARTHLAALGIRREVAERCLGHKIRGVEGTYDRHDYFHERRLALAEWTQLILQAERGKSTVTPIRRGRR
jgi:integrase